jgi:cysteine dioxygenase
MDSEIMPTAIDAIFKELDRETTRLSLPAILEWIQGNRLTTESLAEYMVFHTDRYVRNLVHAGPAYQALVLCWRSGQRSPIHNHRGSNCGVRVLRGIATETVFAKAPNGMPYAVGSRDLSAGHVCASADADMHQMSNLQASGTDLVTLHVYSPPLLRMEMFSLESGAVAEWDDPVNDPFGGGGGI